MGAVLLQAASSKAQPVITIQPTNQFGVYGGNATFSVMATGVGPFFYQWVFNGTNLPSTNVITTVAGSGATSGPIGDGGPATNALILNPSGVTVDQVGNILISYSLSRIRKVDTNGIISTVAGNGSSGFSGDGGAATNAQVHSYANQLNGIVVDGLGNFFLADPGNYRVRKVDTNGTITTIAGTNFPPGFSGDGGAATNAKLQSPEGIAVDRFGNLFIADTPNRRIRKIDTNGIITTVAGNGSCCFSGDGGAATNAQLQGSMGVTADGFGNLFIADTSNSRIRKIDTDGIITTVAGTNSSAYGGDGGSALVARLSNPSRAILDAFGNLLIADTYNNRIRKVDTNGIISTLVGTNLSGYAGDGGAAALAKLYQPLDLALDAYGNLLIADSQNNRIRKVDLAGSPVLQLKSVTTNSIGDYQVIITSPSGSVTSSIAPLSVSYITAQPTNTKAAYGSSASFNVSVTGDAPFGYQWFTCSGRGATATPYIVSGRVFSAYITSGGSGYTSVPQVQFVGGSGSGAAGTASGGMYNGTVANIFITSQGSGYATTPPTIMVDPPTIITSPMSDQTNAMLTLPAVTSADATNYFVVVMNNYGSITSSAVALTVFLPPQNFTAQYLGTGLKMQLTGTPNYPYILQSATNLTPPITWKSVRTNTADSSGNWQFSDSSLNVSQKFYRAMGQ